jgi:hypothetical protein
MAKKKEITTVTDIADVLKLFGNGKVKRETEIQVKDYEVDIGPNTEYVLLDLNTVVTENHEVNITFENVKFKNVDKIKAPHLSNLVFKNCTFSPRLVVDAGRVIMDGCTVGKLIITSDFNPVTIRNSGAGSLNNIHISKASNVCIESCKNIGTLNISVITGMLELRHVTMAEIEIDNCAFHQLVMHNTKCPRLRIRFSNVYIVSISHSEIPEKFFAVGTMIASRLDLRTSKIGLLEFSQVAIIGDFMYDPENIQNIVTYTSVGFKPPEKDFIMYKSCDVRNQDGNYVGEAIVELAVPAKADRVYCGELKIRVSEAKVMKILTREGEPYSNAKNYKIFSHHDNTFIYKIGKTVKPKKEFDNTSGKCGSGIHGFIKFVDAVNYN